MTHAVYTHVGRKALVCVPSDLVLLLVECGPLAWRETNILA